MKRSDFDFRDWQGRWVWQEIANDPKNERYIREIKDEFKDSYDLFQIVDALKNSINALEDSLEAHEFCGGVNVDHENLEMLRRQIRVHRTALLSIPKFLGWTRPPKEIHDWWRERRKFRSPHPVSV